MGVVRQAIGGNESNNAEALCRDFCGQEDAICPLSEWRVVRAEQHSLAVTSRLMGSDVLERRLWRFPPSAGRFARSQVGGAT